ncbi:Serine--pyruvate aminotransferase (EC / L-alanine:glyoxylate aminotransferase (EC [Olavius algarvensis associated proteobacterium Delta 3]|nr:Serine--pyruvate aminotransferase (EC / L-alanine:glyoxylate aminotransferase (EC [Olavius algarvensis associated proteobacterium Delta 3]CAB5129129.1 Serine--pyruvate aminotransferase (EC / L-alanine:glyoxylate aminotransferase (EC [Olavius algarvensis associated proteobacterium Delta 3]
MENANQRSTVVNAADFRDIDPGDRLLMGPGPSDVPARTLQAIAAPCIGHLDPYFLSIMNEVQQLLRFLFQTSNELTIPVSGTGSAGMETCFVNLVEPGDEVAVCVNGVFGTRMADIVDRIGGKLIRIDAEWGTAIDPQLLQDAIKGRHPKVVAVVHAETSTGVCQPLEDLARIAHDAGALFLVDCVTSLGGMPVAIDEMTIDAAYSGTQKCISGPPGLSPVSFSPAAVRAMEHRKTPVVSWYLDLSMVRDYWGTDRKYHHTAPINMIYSLREALRLIAEEGLEARHERHRLNHRALVAGLEAMGLAMLVPESIRLPMLNAVHIPGGVDDLTVRKTLLNQYGIEIGGGLGQFAGKVWRIGLMGHSCRRKNVFLLLAALESVLKTEGYTAQPGARDAVAAVYDPAD